MTDDVQAIGREGFSWRNRRRWVWSGTAFCMLVIIYVLVSGREDPVAETALVSAFYLLGAIGAGYAFGAAVENVSLARGMK